MILITRPSENTNDIINFLKKKKISYLLHPLSILEIENKSLTFENDIFIISSFKVIEYLEKKKYLSLIKEYPLLIVGDKTSKYLKDLDCNILYTANNSSSLSKYIKKNINIDAKLKFLCSNIYNKDFVKDLRDHGFFIRLTRVYKTHDVKKLDKNIRIKISNGELKQVLFYSSFAVKVFFKLLRKHSIKTSHIKMLKYLCFSKRIADTVPKKYSQSNNIIIARKQNDVMGLILNNL